MRSSEYDIIEARLGYRMSDQQKHIVDRLLESDYGQLVSVPMGRQTGKTTLAKAIMRCISDAITVVERYDMNREYEPELHNRMYSGSADIRGTNASLVIFDEVQNMSYIEHVRRDMPRTRFLHMYTPHRGYVSQQDAYRMWTEEMITPWPADMSTEGSEIREAPTRHELEERLNMLRERERSLARDSERMERSHMQDSYRYMMDAIGDTTLEPFGMFETKKKNKEWDDDENSE
jgi:hypothetical protein